MSKYDNLLDALDEFREAREEKQRGFGYDPCGDAEKSSKERLKAAETLLDDAFKVVIGEAFIALSKKEE